MSDSRKTKLMKLKKVTKKRKSRDKTVRERAEMVIRKWGNLKTDMEESYVMGDIGLEEASDFCNKCDWVIEKQKSRLKEL